MAASSFDRTRSASTSRGLTIHRRSSLAHVALQAIHEDLIDVTVFQDLAGQVASPHLANQALATLRRLLNKAKRWGDLHETPLVKLREAEGRSAIITPDIEEKVLSFSYLASNVNFRVRDDVLANFPVCRPKR